MAKEVIINLKIDTTDGEMSVKSLAKGFETSLITMRDLEEASKALSEALKDTRVGTAQYAQLESQLLKVDKALADQKKSLQVLNYEQVGTEINRVVGGLTRMAGGLALVGVSGESIEKIAQTFAVVEGASRLATGGLEAYNGIMKLSNNITILLTAAQTSLTAAQAAGGNSAKAAAVGVRVLNAAMKANPVFLVIGGITALVGVLAFFALRTNEAAAANDRLNKSLADTADGVAKTDKLRSVEADNKKREYETAVKENEKMISYENKRIESLKEFIALGQTQYKEQLERSKGLVEVYEANIDSARTKYLDYVNYSALDVIEEQKEALLGNLDLIENAINLTKDADWGAQDINYDIAIAGVYKLVTAFDKLNEKSPYTENFNKEAEKIAKYSIEMKKQFSQFSDNLGKSAKKEWEVVLQGIDAITNKSTELLETTSKLYDSNQVIFDSNWGELTNEYADALEEFKKNREKAIKEEEERRRKELDDVLSKLEREKKAISDLASEKAKFANDEIKLLEISYGEERQKIIDVAIAREKAAAQEQFLSGKLSKEQLVEELERIENDHNSFLLESEKTLLAELNSIREQNVEDIKARKQRELQASIEGEQAIRSQMALEQLRFEMDMEISALSAEENTQENILEIKRKYAEKEKGLITQNLSEQLDVRRLEYEADIAAKDITAEKKKLIEAKYLSDIQKMNNDAAREIQKINSDISVESQELTMQQLSDLTGKIANTIQQATSSLSDFLQNSADAQSSQMKIKNDEDAEAFKSSLANKEISQEKYDNKIAELNQKKEQQELAAKRKAFEQGKAIAISNAVMQTAQAVIAAFSSAAAVPIAGIALGPIMAGVAGAMGAAQIAVIAGQKFTAARGGVVPGQPSKRDSVDALLAPGEMVINAESSAKYPELLSAINQAGGGISLAPEPVGNSSSNVQHIYKSNEQQQTIKAFVVESEMTDAQRNVNRMRDSASWG